MKKTFLVLLLSGFVLHSIAQDEKEEKKDKEEKVKGFKKDRLFVGGDVTASFYSGGTTLGISPYFGYSINKYVDVAASIGFTYISQRDYFYQGDKLRQNDFGPGAFVRLYPVHFLFAQAQYEHNFIRQKYIPVPGNGPDEIMRVDANSFLIGGGYTSGRRNGNNTFYYFSVLWDVANLPESPYVDSRGRSVPIIKAGVNFALFQEKQRRGRW